jgi:hypothetical protein
MQTRAQKRKVELRANLPSNSLSLYETSDATDQSKMPFSIEIALKMIPEFKGSKEQLHKFLTCCDIVFDTAITDAEQTTFLSVVKTKLCDQAYNLIKYKTINNWAELKTLLKDHYRERRTMAQIQMELLTCRQGKTDVRSFATKIEKILGELDDVCISSQGENAKETIQNLNRATALKAFVDGLHDSIKLIIKACRFDDLPTAIEAACDEERNVAINSRSRENNSNQNCKKCGRSNHITSQCRYNNYSNAPNQTSQNQNRGNHHNYNANNHNFSNQNRGQNNWSKASNQTQTNSGTELFCRYCKRIGHEIEFCRKRIYNNSRKNINNDVQNSQETSGNENGSSSGSQISVRELRTASQ